MPHLFVDLWEANMKTYKNLLEKDYNYLDDIKRMVYKIIDNQSGVLYPIRYNPIY